MTTTPSRITSTYTVVAMEVPKPVYDDIAAKLIAAGYDSVKDGMIDMHGIALVPAADVHQPALTWRDVPPRPAYATPQNALVGDRVRPDHRSSFGPIEKIEGGWMFVRLPDGELVQTDLGTWEDAAP